MHVEKPASGTSAGDNVDSGGGESDAEFLARMEAEDAAAFAMAVSEWRANKPAAVVETAWGGFTQREASEPCDDASWSCEHDCGFKGSFETVSAHEVVGGCIARTADMRRARTGLNHPATHRAAAPAPPAPCLPPDGATPTSTPSPSPSDCTAPPPDKGSDAPASVSGGVHGAGLGVHRIVFGGTRVHRTEHVHRGLDDHRGFDDHAHAWCPDAACNADNDAAIYDRLLGDVDTVDASADGGATHWIPAAQAAACGDPTFTQERPPWYPTGSSAGAAGPEPTLLEALVCAVFRSHTCRATPGSIDLATSGAEWWAQQRVLPAVPSAVPSVVPSAPRPETCGTGLDAGSAARDSGLGNGGDDPDTFAVLPAEGIAADPSSQQWHWDKDLAAFADSGATIHPQLSTVTYLTDGGSPTCVAEVVADPAGGLVFLTRA